MIFADPRGAPEGINFTVRAINQKSKIRAANMSMPKQNNIINIITHFKQKISEWKTEFNQLTVWTLNFNK